MNNLSDLFSLSGMYRARIHAVPTTIVLPRIPEDDLPVWNPIRNVFDTAALSSAEEWTQMKEVGEVTSPKEGRRTVWRVLGSILSRS